MTSWMSHDDLLITSSDIVYPPLSCYHCMIAFIVFPFAVHVHVCQGPLSHGGLIYVPLIVALYGAGVILVEEMQDMGQVLREVRLTATRCKLETEWAGRLYVGCRKVGRAREVTGRMIVDGAATRRRRNTRWTQGMWGGGRLGMLGGDSECSGVLGIDSEGLGTQWCSVVTQGTR